MARLRKNLGRGRTHMASAVGVSKTTISMWERDKTTISPDNLFKVADYLGVTAYELWFGWPQHPGDAIPEFDRITIKSQEQLKANALEWLDNIKQVILELEPRRYAASQSPEGNSAEAERNRLPIPKQISKLRVKKTPKSGK